MARHAFSMAILRPLCGGRKDEPAMKKFLPIGSVVLLKGSTKRVMIVGVKQKHPL